MKAIVFGGTYNPVHIGHLFVACEAQWKFRYDTVIFVPSNIPVHKPNIDIAPPVHRLAMLRLAIEGNPSFRTNGCEINRGGPSYMIETIEALTAEFPIEGKPGLLLGDDLAEGFHKWKDAERLAEKTDILLADRSAGDARLFPYPHRRVDNMLIPISSTEVRSRIRERRAFRYLVPDSVYEYILKNGLYGGV